VSERLLKASHGSALPLERLIAKPFSPAAHVHAYVGLGPLLAFAFESGHGSRHLGLATAAGCTWWFAGHLGLAAQAKYNLVSEGSMLSEAGGELGLAYGW